MPSPRTALKRHGFKPLIYPTDPYVLNICRAQLINPSSLIHLLLWKVPFGLSCILVLMTSWGQVKSQLHRAAKGPTHKAYIMFKCSLCCPTNLSLRNSYVANWNPQDGISLAAVANNPLYTPLSPPSRYIFLRHSLEFLYQWAAFICIWHLTSQTGETMKLITSPANKPFSKPSRYPSQVLPLMVLQSQQELNPMALTRGAVTKGQQMPLKRRRTPSVLTISEMMRIMPCC